MRVTGAIVPHGGARPRRPRPIPSGAMAVYAAYGSNMDPGQMLLRAPHSPLRGVGWLNGWRLTFGGEDVAYQVFVALYDVTEYDEISMDRWEAADLALFRKVRVRVHTLDGEVLAWLYVLDDYEGGLPSARYLGLIADAAEAAGAPDDYVAELRSRPCRSVGPGPVVD